MVPAGPGEKTLALQLETLGEQRDRSTGRPSPIGHAPSRTGPARSAGDTGRLHDALDGQPRRGKLSH